MAKIQIHSMVLGMVGTNVFLLYNEETKEVVIIDPADNAGLIEEQINKLGGKPVAILLTHGHFDHILAAGELRETYGIPIYLEEEEVDVLGDTVKNLSSTWGSAFTLQADKLVKEGDEITLAGVTMRVLHTPGHTKGSCCFYLPEEKIDRAACGLRRRIACLKQRYRVYLS